MKEFRFVNLLGATGTVRRETYDGREYLVVPVVALVEGVIRAMNSKSPELVRASKFTLAPSAWDGRPLFAGHPVENGKPISGNAHRVLERSFGHMQNTKADAKRLLSEAWIDIEKAKARPDSNRVLERCLAAERGDKDAKVIEVSVGAHVGLKAGAGRWDDGKAYDAEWDVILPDHLALLAEHQVGACSRAMGCGALRAAMVTEDGIEELEGEDIAAQYAELRSARDISQQTRDEADAADFAGPNRSFPILKPQDVSAAAHALGRAKGDRDAIRKKIIAIAKRKGWEDALPDAWKPQQRNADSGIITRMKQRFLEVLRLAQTPDDMSSRDLEARLSDKLRDTEGDAYVSFEAFWPVNDPSHVVYTCKSTSDSQPDPLPYPGYVNFDYDTYERPFDLDDQGVVTLGQARMEVTPVVRYEPVEGAVPETDVRYMAAQLYNLAGKRHSSTDEDMLQKIHDHTVDLGATCAVPRMAEAHECACRNHPPQGEENMDRTQKIAALAANPHSAIKDVKVLEKMDDVALKALEDSASAAKTASEATEAALKAAKDGQATAEVALKAAQDALAAPVAEDRLPADVKALMDERKAAIAAETTELVATLKAAQTAYTEEELKAKPVVELRKLASVLKVEAKPVYAGQGVPRIAASGKSYKSPDPYDVGIKAAQSKATH